MPLSEHSPSPSILIVDDTPANVLLLERMLGERGYRTRTVASGALALEAVRSELPDLILLDIAMPEMTGYDVCGLLKIDPLLKDIPVIFVSALHETIDKVIAFSVGGVDYVTKPFQFEEVYARIRTHLNLHRLEKLRGDLTQMIVHELREPLTSILGCLQYLKGKSGQEAEMGSQEFVTIARRSAGEMLNLISSILDVTKIGAGTMQLQREPCDAGALTRSVVDASMPIPGERMVIVSAPDTALWIEADVLLLRRVLHVLLSNAIKYTPPCGCVRVVVAQEQASVRIAIIDSGPGLPIDQHPHIVDALSSREVRKGRLGSGLGLTFCKLVVDAHGGRMGVNSNDGQGSTFWIELPAEGAVHAS